MRIDARTMLIPIATACVVGLALSPRAARGAGPLYTRQERIGVGFASTVWDGQGYVNQTISDYRVAPLKVGWYLDWVYDAHPAQPADTALQYVQMISVRPGSWPPDWVAVQLAVAQNPGATWIIGNEPEGRLNQGNRTPAEYAEIYHQAYSSIRGWDANAKIAIGGVIEPTPLRQRWLDECMAAYQTRYGVPMPVDVWNIHVQVLAEQPGTGADIPAGLVPRPGEETPYTEHDCAAPGIFKTLVTDFRVWMADHGQRDKPLIISEMGVLMPSEYLAVSKEQGDQLVEQFMLETFNWLLTARSTSIGYPADDNLLVQRWLWYSLNDSFADPSSDEYHGFNGSLFDWRTRKLNRFGVRLLALQNADNDLFVPVVRR